MKTILHAYYFNLDPAVGKYAGSRKHVGDAERWEAFKTARTAEGLKVFATYETSNDPCGTEFRKAIKTLDGEEVELETEHIFNNQWNTAPIPGISESGLRLMDWKQDLWSNAHIMTGYYLVQTDEMREIRRNTMTCGYCGKQEPAAKGCVFCPHCLDNENLKESDLPLLRMVCARDSFGAKRAPLTAAESAHLLPLYREAQLNGTSERGKAHVAKARRDIEKEFVRSTANAKEQRDAAAWVLDNVPGLHGNWLFYTHTGRHCFGWRTPLGAEVLSGLLDKISEFPFAYEIKCADGRTLSGG